MELNPFKIVSPPDLPISRKTGPDIRIHRCPVYLFALVPRITPDQRACACSRGRRRDRRRRDLSLFLSLSFSFSFSLPFSFLFFFLFPFSLSLSPFSLSSVARPRAPFSSPPPLPHALPRAPPLPYTRACARPYTPSPSPP